MRKFVNKGKIIRIISNLYTVVIEGKIIEARARGKFRKDEVTPMVGDEVLVDMKIILIFWRKKNGNKCIFSKE